MCPANGIGTVDLFLGVHHGQDSSNSEVMIHATRPRVGNIMNDGTRKGGEPATMLSLHTSPGFGVCWQMHFSLLSGPTPCRACSSPIYSTNSPPPCPNRPPVAAPTPGPNAPPPPAHNGQAYSK